MKNLLHHADLRTLLAVRQTSRAFHKSTSEELRGFLHYELLPRFTDHVDAFMDVISRCRAVLGGEIALAYVLRDPEFHPQKLEVYTGDGSFEELVNLFTYGHMISTSVRLLGVAEVPADHGEDRGVHRYAMFSTSKGADIYVYESSTGSPLGPIARTWATALMNFVTDRSFGCAYPRLTFQRQTLVSDRVFDTFAEEDMATITLLHTANFAFGRDISRWIPQHGATGKTFSPADPIYGCRRDLFCCPEQGRYFGDGGSLIGFMRPYGEDLVATQRLGTAPYGLMTAWRLFATQVCGESCLDSDPVLAPGIVSITTIFSNAQLFTHND